MKDPYLPFPLLTIDNHIMVVVKPAGLPVQWDDSGDDDLLSVSKEFVRVKYQKPGNVFLGLVHRLDRPVSGPVVFARTSKAASRLSDQFRERTVSKRYVCLVEGRCTGEGTLDSLMVERGRKSEVVKNQIRGSKSAVLKWKTIAIIGKRTLLDVQLVTGRKHQIRVQMTSMGFPIVGDLKYGASTEFDGRNMALHCYGLAFNHPVKKDRISFTAKPDWNVDTVIIQRVNDLIKDFKRDSKHE